MYCDDCDAHIRRCGAHHPEYGFSCVIPAVDHSGPHYDLGGGHWDDRGQAPVPPTDEHGWVHVTGTNVEEALQNLRDMARCLCEQCWTSRGLHHWSCTAHYAEDVMAVQTELGRLRALVDTRYILGAG